MRYGRIRQGEQVHWVRLGDDGSLHALREPPWEGAAGDGDASLAAVATARDGAWPSRDAGPRGHLECPVAPGKIVCVGRNYRGHARELGNEVPVEPLLFLKPPSALLRPGGAIELPAQSARVEHEGELAVVLGARLRDATAAEARAAVFGYACANDVTARDLQKNDVQFTRAKGFDTFCPVGPWVVSAAGEACPPEVTITTRVDGVVRQHGAVGDMVFPVADLLAYISCVMTLEPGDLVLTGTPEGVGPLREGERVEVEITGLGTLENHVTRRASRGGLPTITAERRSNR